jgi:hypothetical protein
MKLVPWHDSAKKHECPNVEDVFDCRIEGIVAFFYFKMIRAIPIQSTTGDEAGERLIRPETATGADDEQLEKFSVADVLKVRCILHSPQ